MRRIVILIALFIPLAFCTALICLPFYMGWGPVGKNCFVGTGLTAVFGLIAFISNDQWTDTFLNLIDQRVEEAIVGFAFIVPALLLNCLFLKKLLAER